MKYNSKLCCLKQIYSPTLSNHAKISENIVSVFTHAHTYYSHDVFGCIIRFMSHKTQCLSIWRQLNIFPIDTTIRKLLVLIKTRRYKKNKLFKRSLHKPSLCLMCKLYNYPHEDRVRTTIPHPKLKSVSILYRVHKLLPDAHDSFRI